MRNCTPLDHLTAFRRARFVTVSGGELGIAAGRDRQKSTHDGQSKPG